MSLHFRSGSVRMSLAASTGESMGSSSASVSTRSAILTGLWSTIPSAIASSNAVRRMLSVTSAVFDERGPVPVSGSPARIRFSMRRMWLGRIMSRRIAPMRGRMSMRILVR